MNHLKNRITQTLFSFLLSGATSLSFGQIDLFNQAVKEIESLNRVKAEAILVDILDKYPNYSPAHFQLGLINLNFEKTTDAIFHFNKVIELKSEDAQKAYFELSKLKITEDKNNEALSMLNEVIKNDEANSEAYFRRGQLKHKKGEYESAKNDFNRALLYNSTNGIYHYDRALTEIELNDYPSAIDDLSRVIEEFPELENAYFYRGYAYYQEGLSPEFKSHKFLFEQSLADYNKCIELDIEDETAFFNRGEVHMRLNQYLEAISDFKHAILLDPNDKEAHYHKAMCNYKYGYEQEALKEFTDILKIDPNYADALFQIGFINQEYGNYNESLKAFDKLISIEEAHTDAYMYRGWTNYELKKLPEACADWKKADQLGDKESHHDFHKYCSKVELPVEEVK